MAVGYSLFLSEIFYIFLEHIELSSTLKSDGVLYYKDFGGIPAVVVNKSKAENINNKKVRNGLYLFEKIRDLNTEVIVNINALVFELWKGSCV